VLADELARAKRAEQVRLWDANEETLARRIPWRLPQVPLAEDVAKRWVRFVKWCDDKNVRSLPAKPATVATYIEDQDRARILGTKFILAILDAVERAHDAAGLANPVRCALPRMAIEQIVKVAPPRAWPKEQKAEWALLPIEIRANLTAREDQRDAWFRKQQNQAAEERKALANGASKSDGNIETKGTKSEEIQRRQCEARPGN
jgi:hypothetical protein